ncbi:MAG: hypothetical protein WEB03_13330 [Nitriliruptor sp.]|uniref:hypothetical protein n=1 Tax=Nitriliruptor sp. TaxID=2448056 RepID=UPI0034A05C06
MSVSPGLDATDRQPDTTDPADDPSAHHDVKRSEVTEDRHGRRWIGAVVLAVLMIASVFAVQQIRAADAEATANEQREARAELAADLAEVRDAVAVPARDGQNVASALLRHQLALIAGEGPDTDVGDRLVADLQEAADELEAASTTPLPERPQMLPVATIDPIYARLEGLEGQAADLAATYRDAAEHASASIGSVRALEAAALTYADSTDQLPSGDDPDVVADAWRAERDQLEAYASAVADAADDPVVAPLAEAHDQLVTGLRTFADDAIERLEADDLDGYNALLAERLGGDDPFGFAAQLAEAREEVSQEALAGPLEDARARGLGLLTELEELRRITPAQLAEVR